jgi:hypothetical protein
MPVFVIFVASLKFYRMKGFIEVKDQNHGFRSVSINVKFIHSIEPYTEDRREGAHCLIRLPDIGYYVKETYKEVSHLIDMALL